MNSINGLSLLSDGPNDGVREGHDFAPHDPDALSLGRLTRWLDEIQNQPAWRRESDKCCDYYDGNQLDADTLNRLEDKGLGPLITNLVQPTINAVLGMEAKTRTDWRVGADDEQFLDVAEALSAKLHEAERESQADRAISDAYAEMVKAGFSAVEVSRESNPFRYPYRVSHVHRSELFWDWQGKALDWSDARYVVRKKMYDADNLVAFFPQHAQVIKDSGSYSYGWSDFVATLDSTMSADLLHSLEQGLRTTWDDLYWRDTSRQAVTCFEVWYRVYKRGLVLKLPYGRVIEFNADNEMHRALVAAGAVQPQVAVFDKIRCAFFCGPVRLMDRGTQNRRFPYIPFFGYREDLTRVPYGIIRSMLSPQDEVNARTAKMMWLLNSRRTFIDSDALDAKYNTLSDVSREIGRADAFVVTNPAAHRGQIRVEDNMALSAQQFQVMQERKNAIQEAAGVYSAMMGQNSNASSGLAIQSLVEQGVTTLAEINDNYRVAKRLVGEELLSLVKEDTTGQVDVMVDTGTSKRRVMVNIPRVDERGMRYKENDVQVAPVRVALQDVPSTPTYRAQQFAQMSEILKSMPPQYQALLIPFVIEMTDFAHRKEIAEFLRRQAGIVQDPDSPEVQQANQQQAQMQQAQLEAQMQDAQSKVAERQARAQKLMAEAQKLQVQMGQGDGAAGYQNAVLVQQQRMQAMAAEIERLRLQLADKSAERAFRMKQTQLQESAETDRLRLRLGVEQAQDIERRYSALNDEMNQTIQEMQQVVRNAPPYREQVFPAQGYGQGAGNGVYS